MASFLKRNGKWQARIQRRGMPPVAKSFTAKADAIAWARKIEAEIDRGSYAASPEAERTTLRDALSRYEREITPKKKGAKPEVYRLAMLKRTTLADHALTRLTSAAVAKYRDERLELVAPNTVKNELNLLSAVIEAARIEWGMGITNPVRLVKRPRLPAGRDRRLLADEERLLFAGIAAGRTGYLDVAVQLALETAMRLGELSGLRWEHIDLTRRVAHLPDTKNATARDVPLSTAATFALERLTRAAQGAVFPVQADSIKQAFRAAVVRARDLYKAECAAQGTVLNGRMLLELHFHDLRHEAVTRLFEQGFNIMEVAAISGHKTLAMLKRYTHLRAEDLARRMG